MDITQDIKRFSNICWTVGYLGGISGEDVNAEIVVGYITELFNAKRDVGGAYFTEDGIRYWKPDWDEREDGEE